MRLTVNTLIHHWQMHVTKSRNNQYLAIHTTNDYKDVQETTEENIVCDVSELEKIEFQKHLIEKLNCKKLHVIGEPCNLMDILRLQVLVFV